MSELEEQAEALNTLLGLDLKLMHFNDAVFVECSTGDYWDHTIPWTLFNGVEVLLERSDFRTVSGYLSALEWTGKNAVVRFEKKEKLKIRVEVDASFYDGDNQPIGGGYRTHIINLSNVDALERLIEYFGAGALDAEEVSLSQADCIPYEIGVDDDL